MDYEKAYKAVLKTATQWIKDGCTDKEKICLECVFPELCESEDERIRKEMISFLRSPFIKENLTDEKVAPWIAYLEKQKEQKPILKFKVGDKIHLINGTSPNYEDDCITIEEIGIFNYFGKFKEGFVPIKEQDKWELAKEQKPADWTDKDKRILDDISHILISFKYTEMAKAYKQAIEKLLYSRPSWKPSEEQMDALNKARRFIPYNCDILESLYEQLKKL